MNLLNSDLAAAVQAVDPWALLTSFLADSPYPLQVYSPAGRSLFVNDAFLQIFTSAPPPEYNVLQDAVLARHGLLDELRRAFQGEAVELRPIWYNPADNGQVPVPGGRPLFLRLRAFPLRDAAGAVALIIFQFEDLTAQQSVLEEKERLLAERNAVLEQSPHGIIIADPAGRLVLFNPAAVRIWAGSAPASSIEEWSSYRAFHPDGTPYSPDDWQLARCLATGEPVGPEEINFQRFDGTEGTMLASSAPLRDQEGRMVGGVVVFADITRFKELERLRDEFVSVAAHELRTPLTSLLGYTQLLVRWLRSGDSASEKLERTATNILRAGRRLETLVNQLLDISRLEHGRLTLAPAPMDLVELARQVIDDLEFRTADATFILDAPAAIYGEWDAGRLEQVLLNLLDNALKYGRRGAPVILRLSEDAEGATVGVENEGTGLDESVLSQLFDRYYRVPAHTESGTPGLGLGLYVAREIVTLHGGRIWAENRPEGGVRVSFTLPRGEPNDHERQPLRHNAA